MPIHYTAVDIATVANKTYQCSGPPRASQHELVHGPPGAVTHLFVKNQGAHVEEIQGVLFLPHPPRGLERLISLKNRSSRRGKKISQK